MSDRQPFTDPDSIASMESEHLPLWRGFIRLFAHLLVPGVRVMDFGCSRGGLLVLICRHGAQVSGSGVPLLGVGIDVDEPAMRNRLAEAAQAARGKHPLVFTTSAPGAFPGQFDLVVSHEVVYLLPNPAEVFAGIHASLAPGGHFCFTTGCHLENPLWPLWKTSFATLGITEFERGIADYEAALRSAGFGAITRDRLLLPKAEYDAWVRSRGSIEPNPEWFPSASAEEEYYTRTGKMVLTARKG